MNPRPQVSIIVPVFNAARYLRRCVGSMVEQTYGNLDIVLVDDGSSDGSSALCDELQSDDARIQVYHQENRGVSAARNAGMTRALGDLFYFVDADDFIAPRCVETLVRSLEEHKADVATVGFKYHPTDGVHLPGPSTNVVSECTGSQALTTLLYREGVIRPVVWDTLCRRELLEGVRFPVGVASGEDGYVKFKILTRAQKIVVNTSPQYLYCQSEDGVMRSIGAPTLSKLRHLEVSETILEESQLLDDEHKRAAYFWVFWDAINSPALTVERDQQLIDPYSLACRLVRQSAPEVWRDHRVSLPHRLVALISVLSLREASLLVRVLKQLKRSRLKPASDRGRPLGPLKAGG